MSAVAYAMSRLDGSSPMLTAPVAHGATDSVINGFGNQSIQSTTLNRVQFAAASAEGLLAESLLWQWVEKEECIQSNRDQLHSLAQLVIIDTLCDEWMCEDIDKATVHTYLLDQVIPTVVLGLEKLLIEIDKLDLVNADADRGSFNPINYLAQYLMRNNPKYSNFSEASPYIRGMRKTSERLKQDLFHLTDNKLSTMRRSVDQRRRLRERCSADNALEIRRRKEAIARQFYEWNDGGKVEVSLILNSFKSFSKNLSNIVPANQLAIACFTKSLQSRDENLRALYLNDYVSYVMEYLGLSFGNDAFDLLLVYMSKCIKMHRHSQYFKRRADGFIRLFNACDIKKVGQLDRHRILMLLDMFYNKASSNLKQLLANPRYTLNYSLRSGGIEEESSAIALEGVDGDSATLRLESESDVRSQKLDDNLEAVSVPDSFENAKLKSLASFTNPQRFASDYGEQHSFTLPSADDFGLFELVSRKKSLSQQQFIMLMNLFLIGPVDEDSVRKLFVYIREGYADVEFQPSVSRIKQEVDKKIGLLFTLWDNDSAGNVNVEFVECMFSLYNPVAKLDAVNKAKTALEGKINFDDGRLSEEEFSLFIREVVTAAGGDSIDDFIAFLHDATSKTAEEISRGELRRNWLHTVEAAGGSKCFKFDSVFEALFTALYKDNAQHGDGKQISASIAFLRPSTDRLEHGQKLLHFVAASAEQAHVLGKSLLETAGGPGFACIKAGKPLQVSNETAPGNIHFWEGSSSSTDQRGSYVLIPLHFRNGKVFGLFGIDLISKCTLQTEALSFKHHEIDYYQGLARTLGKAYHNVATHLNLLLMSFTSTVWLLHRCQHVKQIDVYTTDNETGNDLWHVLSSSERSQTLPSLRDIVAEKVIPADVVHSDQLFICAQTSEPLQMYLLDDYHLIVPLRHHMGHAATVIDINVGTKEKLSSTEKALVSTIMTALQDCYTQAAGNVLEKDDPIRLVELRLQRRLLSALCEKVRCLDRTAYTSLEQLAESNVDIQKVITAAGLVLQSLVTPDNHAVDSWQNFLQLIVVHLVENMDCTDCIARIVENERLEPMCHKLLENIRYESLLNSANNLSCYLFDWVSLYLISLSGIKESRVLNYCYDE